MSQKRTHIRSLTLVNFKGVFFKTLELHQFMSNLIGHNGAGKTTIMGALLMNRVPDNRLIRLRNNSDSGQDRNDNGIWGRIGQGVSYSLVDYELFDGRRVIAGVQIRRLSHPKVEIKQFAITGIDFDIAVRDLVMKSQGDNRYEPLEAKALRNQVALNGGELERFDTVARYMDWQFDQRIIPRRMENTRDRHRYYRMLETSLYGGLSSEIQKGLKDYLLAADTQVKKSINSMQSALQETRKTRNKINDTQNHRKTVKAVLESSYALGEHVLARAEQSQRQLSQQLEEKRREEKRVQDSLESKKQQFAAIQSKLDRFEVTREELDFREDEAHLQLEYARDLSRLQGEKQKLSNEAENTQRQLQELNEQLLILTAQHDEQNNELKLLEEDVAMLVEQLSSVEQAYSEEARKAGLYQAALRSLEEVRDSLERPEVNADQLTSIYKQIKEEKKEKSLSYHHQKPLLEQAELIRNHFDQALGLLSGLDGKQVVVTEAATRTDYWLQQARELTQRSHNIPTLQQQLKQRREEQAQLEKLQSQLANLPEEWSSEITDETSWNKSLNRAEQEYQRLQILQDQQIGQQQQNQRQQDQLERQLDQARVDFQSWNQCQSLCREIAQIRPESKLTGSDDYQPLRLIINSEQKQALHDDLRLGEELSSVRERLNRLATTDSRELQQLQRLAEITGGVVISDYFDNDDISITEAAWLEAKFGPLRHALQVRDIDKAADILREQTDRPEHIWLLAGTPGDSFSEDDYLEAPLDQAEDGSVLVHLSNNISRLSLEPEFPTIGKLAREKEQRRLTELEEQILDQRQELAVQQRSLEKNQQLLDQLAALTNWLDEPEPQIHALEDQIQKLTVAKEVLIDSLQQTKETAAEVSRVVRILHNWQSSAWLLIEDPDRSSIDKISQSLEQAREARDWLNTQQKTLQQLEQHRLYLEQPPAENLEELKEQLEKLGAKLSQLGQQQSLLEVALNKVPDLRFAESLSRRDEKESLQNILKQEHEKKEQHRKNLAFRVDQLKQQNHSQEKRIAGEKSRLQEKQERLLSVVQEIETIPLQWQEGLEEQCRFSLAEIKTAKDNLILDLNQCTKESAKVTSERENLEQQRSNTIADIHRLEPAAHSAWESFEVIRARAAETNVLERLHTDYLRTIDSEQLRTGLADARAHLEQALANDSESELFQLIINASLSDLPGLFESFLASQQYLAERMDKTLVMADDPRLALEQLETQLIKLETLLNDAEKRFLAESDHLGRHIQRRINMERKQILQLNHSLSDVFFGTIRAIKIDLQINQHYQNVLDALQTEFYADLFRQPEMSVEQALEAVFKKETGGSIAGEKLLDYREYINLKILVQRAGNSQFEEANPTSLSTGEAIGTGLAILTVVLHSWELATHIKYEKKGAPFKANRLLFLDEAARLDAKALATLEELCRNQSLQLLVGAPDNVLPKNGVTYRMVRLMEPYEHVIFSAVRGRLPETGQL